TTFTTSAIITGTVSSQNMTVNHRPFGRTATNCFSTNIPGGSNTRIAAPEPENNENLLTVFPNPLSSADVLNLKWNSSINCQAAIDVYDVFGRQIMHKEVSTESGFNQTELNLNGLKAGTYLLILNEAGEMRQVRFTVDE
ncbi:MAG: T9SS type A sorting domain-containing protein, partial [Bacteroidia bacterium]